MVNRKSSIVLCLAALLGLVGAARAQQLSIMVQPVSLELQPKPGERVNVPVDVRNTSATDPVTVEAKLWPLYQNQEGRFSVMDPEAMKPGQTAPAPPGKPCLAWTRIDADRFDLAPASVRKVMVSLQVPSNARGLYSGTLIVQTVPTQRPGAIAIRLRFLVPILVQVYGPAVGRKVELKAAGMGLAPKTDKEPVGTHFGVSLKNAGESLARLKGGITIFTENSGRWRKVTQVDLPERRILPEVEATVQQRTTQRFPKGKYRLVANLTMEGARLPQLATEVDYPGDPEVSAIATDAELEVLPGRLEVDGPPGSTRSVTLTVRNTGTERVSLSPGSALPAALQGVAMGLRQGDALGCQSWLSFGDVEVTIPPGQERKMRMQVAVPADKVNEPYYYAQVLVKAKSPEGQPVGEAEALVIVRNKSSDAAAKLDPSGRVTVTRADKNKYNFVARFANTGTVHLDPICKGMVTDTAGLQSLKQFDAERQKGLILPLGTAVFSANVDFAGIAPGVYVVKLIAEYEKEKATFSVPVRVADTKDGKQVEVVEQAKPAAKPPAKPPATAAAPPKPGAGAKPPKKGGGGSP